MLVGLTINFVAEGKAKFAVVRLDAGAMVSLSLSFSLGHSLHLKSVFCILPSLFCQTTCVWMLLVDLPWISFIETLSG